MNFESRALRAQTFGPGAVSSRENSVERSQSEGIPDKQLHDGSQHVEPSRNNGIGNFSSSPALLSAEIRDTQAESHFSVEYQLTQLPGLLALQDLNENLIPEVDLAPNNENNIEQSKSCSGQYEATMTDVEPEQRPTLVTEVDEPASAPAYEASTNNVTNKGDDVVMDNATQEEDAQKQSSVKTACREAMQPSLDTEDIPTPKVPTHDVGPRETMQPSIYRSKEIMQPSIDTESLSESTGRSGGKVQDWLRNSENQHPVHDHDKPEAIDSIESQNDGSPEAGLRTLQQWLAQNNSEPPDHDDRSIAGGEEAATHWEQNNSQEPSPPRNRVLESVRTGRSRPGSRASKRKRGNSSAGRCSKSRSMSRNVKEEDQDSGPRKELPQRSEFELTTTQRLGPHNFKWGPERTPAPLETTKLTNLGVELVDCMNDGLDELERYVGPGGAVVSKLSPPRRSTSAAETFGPPRPPKRTRRARKRQQTPAVETDKGEDEGVVEDDGEDQEILSVKKPVSVSDLPDEIIRKILCELLISHAQIYVYENFTKVYPVNRRRTQLNIDTAILTACKRMYYAGISVLYGENTFVYSIRDAPGCTAPPPVDVDQIAQDDSSQAAFENEDDDASEYVDDGDESNAGDHRVGRGFRRPKQKAWEGDLRVNKYFSLFRHIVIEAEHNRYGIDTMEKMANAIEKWNDPREVPEQASLFPGQPSAYVSQSIPENKCKTKTSKAAVSEPQIQESNLHTLTVRIFPSRKLAENSVEFFTFVSFFETGSPIISALRKTLSQFIRLEIVWKYMHVPTRPSCLMVDMRPLRIKRNVGQGGRDIWRHDKLILTARREGVHNAISALDRVQGVLLSKCEKQHEVARPQDRLVADDWEDGEVLDEVDMGDAPEFVE